VQEKPEISILKKNFSQYGRLKSQERVVDETFIDCG
jgi:hypothetical protein